jgi:hypothetical protein
MNEALVYTYNQIYDILIKANSNIHNPTHPRTLYPPPHYSTPLHSSFPPLTPIPLPHILRQYARNLEERQPAAVETMQQ